MDIAKEKTVVVGAGPVGALAALYAATLGGEVEIYELRGGAYSICVTASSLRLTTFHDTCIVHS